MSLAVWLTSGVKLRAAWKGIFQIDVGEDGERKGTGHPLTFFRPCIPARYRPIG